MVAPAAAGSKAAELPLAMKDSTITEGPGRGSVKSEAGLRFPARAECESR